MTRSGRVILHLGIPLMVGLIMGLNQVRVGEHLTLPVSVFYWIVASLVTWGVFEFVTRGVALVLRPWSPPFLLVLVVGMLIASIPGRTFLYGLADALTAYRTDGTIPRSPSPLAFSWTFVASHLRSWSGFFTFWLGVNVTLVHLMGVCRFGHQVHRAPLVVDELPTAIVERAARPNARFLARTPPHLGSDLLALSAQDHYLEVHTANGSALIHYALSEAVAELAASGVDGLRIHRSHWVARNALVGVASEGRSYLACVSNGLRLPVGTTYIGVLKNAGIIPARTWQAA